MLGFIVRFHILNPDAQLREHEIATRVLGRKDDFDPAYDNIVRVQASHLRKKLVDYFETEGRQEPLIISLPKGGYVPIFEPRPSAEAAVEIQSVSSASPAGPTTLTIEDVSAEPRPRARLATRHHVALASGLAALLLLCVAVFVMNRSSSQVDGPAVAQILSAVGHRGDKVAVVLPDTSLLMLQKLVHSDISAEQYANSNFVAKLASQGSAEDLRYALSFIGNVRTTTLNEAEVGTDFVQAIREHNMEGALRYARDMNVRDLGAGNYILIGNPRSNPWVSLFASRSNFVFTGGKEQEDYIFKNKAPAAGEPAAYVPEYSPKGYDNYADITLTSNLTGTGFVLIIDGSDVPANEAAARLLLQGRLPSEIETRLKKGELKTFEVLLRGHHNHAESNDQLNIVTYRVPPKTALSN